jgi:poly(A) polymerase
MLQRQDEFSSAPVLPPRLINGHQLMKMGYPPGPDLGRVLNAAHDAQLEGAIATEEEAVAWVREHFPQESTHE